MNKYLVTLDYTGIVHPDTGEEFVLDDEAADQFVAEISYPGAFAMWDDLVGYRLLERDARRRWVVQFVVESADEETFDRDIQKWLLCASWAALKWPMSGNYVIGREVAFMVTVAVEYHVTVAAYGRDAGEAEENAQREIKRAVTNVNETRSRIEAYAVSALTHPRLPTRA